MKRVLFIFMVLVVMVCVAEAQQVLPDWTEITSGIFFKTDMGLIQPGGSGDAMTYILSLAASNRVEGAKQLQSALLELRSHDPAAFDAVFTTHNLTIALPPQ